LIYANNAFFGDKNAVFAEGLWQEQSDITYQAISGISPIDAIRENFFSSSPEIATGICSGCIKPGSAMV
jgi:hypothetical protein